MSRIPKHLIVDDFQPREFHDRLLQFILDSRDSFAPSALWRDGNELYDSSSRKSWRCDQGLGHLKDQFKNAVRARQDELFSALGMPPFEISAIELELSAHRDGNFFKQHQDTSTGVNRNALQSDRLLSAVYYLHSKPSRFAGGELALHPFGPGDPILIEPNDNRLVAFPSFAIHEVKTVYVPDNQFANARFSVNCWLHRAR